MKAAKSPEERFWTLVDTNGPVSGNTGTRCWIWLGKPNSRGYGRLGMGGGVNKMAHRFAYESFVGPIPPGHEIDHDDPIVGCNNRMCVNPLHLVATTTNARRRRTNTSGAWAVLWNKAIKRWQVSIMFEGTVYTPTAIGLPFVYAGDPPPAAAPPSAIEARDKLVAYLGLPPEPSI